MNHDFGLRYLAIFLIAKSLQMYVDREGHYRQLRAPEDCAGSQFEHQKNNSITDTMTMAADGAVASPSGQHGPSDATVL